MHRCKANPPSVCTRPFIAIEVHMLVSDARRNVALYPLRPPDEARGGEAANVRCRRYAFHSAVGFSFSGRPFLRQ